MELSSQERETVDPALVANNLVGLLKTEGGLPPFHIPVVPFTWEMEPGTALMFLVAVYVAASYGGSITAITINTPGTPSAVVTAMDGYPMFKSGRAGEALGVSLVSSTMAGLIGSIILILFSVPLAAIAVKFHPAEYVGLAILGLATVASLGGRDWRKSLTP